MFVISGVNRIYSTENHRMNLLKTREGRRGMLRIGDRVAHLDFLWAFNVRGHVTGLPNFELIAHVRFRIEASDFLHLHVLARMQQLNLDAGLEFTIEYAYVGDHPFVGVEV